MVVYSWKTVENYLVKILENSASRVLTDQEFPSIDQMFLFDRSNKNRESIESSRLFMLKQESRIDWVKQIVYAEFIKISIDWEFL